MKESTPDHLDYVFAILAEHNPRCYDWAVKNSIVVEYDAAWPSTYVLHLGEAASVELCASLISATEVAKWLAEQLEIHLEKLGE